MKPLTQKSLWALFALFCIVLYLAGVFSGLATKRVIEEQTEQEIMFLRGYVNQLDTDMRSFQLQERVLRSLGSERCDISDRYFGEIAQRLNTYWEVLPERLEEYEQYAELSQEYLALKAEYTQVSLQAWIVAKENFEMCNSSVIPLLYFYTPQCEACVRQGQELDLVKSEFAQEDKTVIVFTLDKEFEDPTIRMLRSLFDITQSPAIILNSQVLQGDVFSYVRVSEEVRQWLLA